MPLHWVNPLNPKSGRVAGSFSLDSFAQRRRVVAQTEPDLQRGTHLQHNISDFTPRECSLQARRPAGTQVVATASGGSCRCCRCSRRRRAAVNPRRRARAMAAEQ